VLGAGRIRGRWLALAAFAGALAALLAAAQPVSGVPGAGLDTLHPNLGSSLDKLDSDERTKVIVQLDAPATDARVAALEREVGQLAISHRFSIVNGFSAFATLKQIEALARAPSVTQVEANATLVGANDKAQAAFGVSKARLDVPSLDGAGVTVAVLDSGIDPGHPDLAGRVVQFRDFVNNQLDPYDDNGHGTHVSAIVAGDGDDSGGLYRGVAPGASIVAAKVLDSSLHGGTTAVLDGIDWVIKNRVALGIRMIVLSMQTAAGECSDGSEALSVAINNATTIGLLVVVAAGNKGPGMCSIGSPAAATGALTVGAMADTGEGGFQLAPFSSRGPTRDGRIKPDVVGPGVGITSAKRGSGYEPRSGTSMAAPFVAGVAALMLDANPTLTPKQLKDMIVGTAIDWGRSGDNTVAGSAGPDIDYGAGRLDAYAAIRAAGAALASPPPLPAHEVHHGTIPGTGAYADHEVTVNDTAFPMAATLIAPGGSPPDLDLALFNPSGTEVAASRLIGVRQEQLTFQPTAPGSYTLRVASRSGAGGYFIDVSGATSTQPLNGLAPTISGLAREGEILRAQTGAWSGGLPFSFVFQWQRCDVSGGACGPIPGIAGPEYQLTSADIDATIRVIVTATNRAGSSSAASAPTGPVAPLPPRSLDPPSIVGTARDGNTLHAERGTWISSRPLAITHQWLRCRSGADGCTPVPGATASTFALGSGDIGRSVTVTVTAANAGGQQSVTATPVAVGARRPESTTRPIVSGRAQAGAVLHAEEGRWAGTRPLVYKLRWQRCGYNGRGCETIRGAIGPRYLLRSTDAGRRIRVRVRADNGRLPGGGAGLAYSRVTRIVKPAVAWLGVGAARGAVLTGTRGRDVIRGTRGADIIRGLGGNDRILGLGGDDLILGGDGRDVLSGGSGRDIIRGEDGRDTLIGGAGADSLLGGAGADLLRARDRRADSLFGGSGSDLARADERLDELQDIERSR
jgi:serine protease AprX